MTLSCGSGVFSSVSFASYGTPIAPANGTCAFSRGACDAPSSAAVVAAACVGQSFCSIPVEVATFAPDPCGGVYKFLAVTLAGACAPPPPGVLCALAGYSRTYAYQNTTATGQTYYQRLQPLDDTNHSNWFTEYAPQALLYGALLQAMPFLKNDERIPMWQAQYQQIIQTLKTEDVQRMGDRQAVALDS
jgi:hypothetical protein